MTDHDLNRRVAEALGWTYSDEEIWADDVYGTFITHWHNENGFPDVPLDYAHDLNAAWQLLPDYAVVTKTPLGVTQVRLELGVRVNGSHQNPATAICEAFLAWQSEPEP